MQISERTEKYLHAKLPIDQDEKVLALYRHHWFAYVSSWILGIVIIIVVMAVAVGLTMVGGDESALAQNRTIIIAAAGIFSSFVLVGTFIPVYLRSQEQVVLTEEALLQVLQPSLFASRVDHLNLQRIDDVSVGQDFFGTLLGYGKISIETPGEQDHYEFTMLAKPHDVAREIAEARENYEAAMQSGRIPTSIGQAPAQAPAIDPQQYQQFLQYQQMMQQGQQAQAPAQNQVATQSPENTGQSDDQPRQ